MMHLVKKIGFPFAALGTSLVLLVLAVWILWIAAGMVLSTSQARKALCAYHPCAWEK